MFQNTQVAEMSQVLAYMRIQCCFWFCFLYNLSFSLYWLHQVLISVNMKHMTLHL